MNNCGKRLCVAMATTLLAVALNVVLVISGGGDALYAWLPGVQLAGDPPGGKRYALADKEPGIAECTGDGHLDRQPLNLPYPGFAAVSSPGVRAC